MAKKKVEEKAEIKKKTSKLIKSKNKSSKDNIQDNISNTTVKKKKAKTKKSRDDKEDKESTNNIDDNLIYKTINRKHRKKYFTHDGHELTLKEHKFIDNYIATGNGRQSVIQAGYESKAPSTYANDLLNKKHIADEVEYLMSQQHENRIATGEQVMEFFTKVMNGEIKDQFQLDASLNDRIKAGQELAKRTVDIATKVAGVTQGQNEVTIRLDWNRRREE